MIVTGTISTWIRKGSSDKFRNIFNSRYVDQSFHLEIQIWFLEILWREIGASRYEEHVKKQYKTKILLLYISHCCTKGWYITLFLNRARQEAD